MEEAALGVKNRGRKDECVQIPVSLQDRFVFRSLKLNRWKVTVCSTFVKLVVVGFKVKYFFWQYAYSLSLSVR